MKALKIMLKTGVAMLVLAVLAVVIFIRSGTYNVAADEPHWALTYDAMHTLRERSIHSRAEAIEVPALADASLIRSGAGNYNAMCVSCHLKPGAEDTELSLGLYPRPPAWSKLGSVDPREAFWVIKHGVKMSGMPAWGKSLDDRYIWGMVAFIRTFPGMTADQYAAQVAASPGHDHGGGETDVGMGHGTAEHHDPATRSSFEPIEDPLVNPSRPEQDAGHDDGHDH